MEKYAHPEKKSELVGYVKKIDNEDRVRFVKKDDKDALMMKTIVKPIRTTNDFSLVEVKIITGRMHLLIVFLHLFHLNRYRYNISFYFLLKL